MKKRILVITLLLAIFALLITTGPAAAEAEDTEPELPPFGEPYNQAQERMHDLAPFQPQWGEPMNTVLTVEAESDLPPFGEPYNQAQERMHDLAPFQPRWGEPMNQ